MLDYKKLNKYIKDKIQDSKIYYLFLDEIQNVDNFEKVVNSLRASIKNISIFLTGSNMFYLVLILYLIKNMFL